MPEAVIDADRPEYFLSDKAVHALELTDAMPRELRQCVHEFGFPIVHAFVQVGVTKPRHIRHLVTVCWMGARAHGDRARGGMKGQIDALLVQSGAELTADGLLRFLKQSGVVIVPLDPPDFMVDASIEATAEMGPVSKRQKHQGRLRAALRAGAVRLWPGLFAALLALGIASGAMAEGPGVRVLPDDALTPGAIASTDEAEVCGIVDGLSYSKRHRQTSAALKALVRERYGAVSCGEIDHRCPLALGCKDAIENLWCQTADGTWTFREKDRLEVYAWERVCRHHTMTLADAQAMFLAPADWRVSYCHAFPGDVERCGK